MPQVAVVFYADENGSAPVLDWLKQVSKQDKRIPAKCRERIERLKELGYELRRPEADVLRDGIYELRVRWSNANYRILYFFAGDQAAVLAAGLMKEDKVPDRDINTAMDRRTKFLADPTKHTYSR